MPASHFISCSNSAEVFCVCLHFGITNFFLFRSFPYDSLNLTEKVVFQGSSGEFQENFNGFQMLEILLTLFKKEFHFIHQNCAERKVLKRAPEGNNSEVSFHALPLTISEALPFYPCQELLWSQFQRSNKEPLS